MIVLDYWEYSEFRLLGICSSIGLSSGLSGIYSGLD